MSKRCTRFTIATSRLLLSQMFGTRVLFLLTSTSLVIYFYCMQLQYTPYDATERFALAMEKSLEINGTKDFRPKFDQINNNLKDSIEESEKNTNKDFWHSKDNSLTDSIEESQENQERKKTTKDFLYSKIYLKKLPKDLKYMLLWSEYEYAPFYFFEDGQRSFIKNNCSMINCYVTTNRTLFKGDITKFDAVAFNGRTMSVKGLPYSRSPKQKYIYFNMESSDNYPVCENEYDGFFNWTATYKLNSDILFPYITIRNKQGEIVGPQINMQWPDKFSDVNDNLSSRLMNKTKAAAWFVSHCSSRSGRDNFVRRLQKALQHYGLVVDIYGSCGPLKCPRNETDICNSLLEKDYFFYLSLENSLADDYVTEKLLTALQHDTLPIVFGEANYSRFVPPGSYIRVDSMKIDIKKLAATMDQIIKSPEMYRNFFRWKNHYRYSDPSTKENVCAVCTALNNNEKFKITTVYDQFRKWWNPNYKTRC